MKEAVLSVVTSCSSETARRFVSTYQFYLEDQRVSQTRNELEADGTPSTYFLHVS
jgi:hypothetical protein